MSGKNILVVHEEVPFIDSGSDNRLYQIIKTLVGEGYRVTFVGRRGGTPARYRRQVERLGVDIHTPEIEQAHGGIVGAAIDIAGLLDRRPMDTAILFHWYWFGLSVAEQCLPIIRRHSPQTRIVVLTDDVHWLRQEREARFTGSRLDLEKARGFRGRDRFVYENADLVLAITQRDGKAIDEDVSGTPVAVVRHGGYQDLALPVPGFAERANLLFVGGGMVPANRLGIDWFAREIFPRLLKRLPEIKLEIAGQPPFFGWAPSASAPLITLGFVDHLDACLSRCRVFVSPMPFATGIVTKNLLALAAGLPLVTTSAGAEGLEATDEEVMLVVDDPEHFAEAVAEVYTDRSFWARVSQSGQRHVRQHYSMEFLREDLKRAFSMLEHCTPKPKPAFGSNIAMRIESVQSQTCPDPVLDKSLSRCLEAHIALAKHLLADGNVRDAKAQAQTVLGYAHITPQREFVRQALRILGAAYRAEGAREDAQACLDESRRWDH